MVLASNYRKIIHKYIIKGQLREIKKKKHTPGEGETLL